MKKARLDTPPPTTDLISKADMVHLECIRNYIYAYAERDSLSDFQFSSHWQEIHATGKIRRKEL